MTTAVLTPAVSDEDTISIPPLGGSRVVAIVSAMSAVVFFFLVRDLATYDGLHERGSGRLADAVSASSTGQFFVMAVPVWIGSRLRQRRVESLGTVRRASTIALEAVSPFLVGQLVASVVIWAIVIRSVPADLGSWALVCAWAVSGLGLTLLAVALGARLPLPFALLATLAFTWYIFANSPAYDAPWIRYLAGHSIECCWPGRVLDPRLGFAAALFGVGLIAIALTAVSLAPQSARSDQVRWSLAGAFGVAALLLSAVIATSIGWDDTQRRPAEQIVCADAAERPELTVCLWPEHEPQRDMIEQVLVSTAANLDAAGLTAPSRASEAIDAAESEWPIYSSLTMQPDDFQWMSIAMLAPELVNCSGDDTQMGTVFAALVEMAGYDQTELGDWLMPESIDSQEVALALTLPPDRLKKWIDLNRANGLPLEGEPFDSMDEEFDSGLRSCRYVPVALVSGGDS